MAVVESQEPSGPRRRVLEYWSAKVARGRKRRNYAMIGGIAIFLLYPCLIFSRVAYDIVFHWDDGPDKLGFYLTLPCSLFPIMDQGDFAGYIAIVVNAAFWSAVWVVPALIRRSKMEGRPILANPRRPARKTRRRLV